MKRLGLILLTFCVLASLLTSFAAAAPVDGEQGDIVSEATPESDTSYSIDSSMSVLGNAQFIENAKSAFLYEVNSGTLMYAWNADEQLYPASLVKIMTALMAVEKGSLSDVITVTEDVISSVAYNAVSADLQPDEQITLEALLYCMMVGSANDAAAVIADHISGSQEAFVEEMNTYAQELGCTNTNFMNVHGLHHEQQYTSARDMARILSTAMKNETFRTLFATVHYTVPATNKSAERKLSSGNFLMNKDSMEIYFDERVTGGRTGISEDGRRCLAASAEGNGLLLVSVVMGSESVVEEDGYTTTIYGSFKESSMLFDKGLDGYKAVQVLFPDQAVTQHSVIDGENHVVLGAKTAVSAVLPAGVDLDDLTFRYPGAGEIHAPVTSGDALSKVEVWHGNTCVASADLYAMNSVKSVSQMQAHDENEDNDNAAKTILVVIGFTIGGVVLLVVILRLLPKIRRFLSKRHMKQYRRSRRRSR